MHEYKGINSVENSGDCGLTRCTSCMWISSLKSICIIFGFDVTVFLLTITFPINLEMLKLKVGAAALGSNLEEEKSMVQC